MSAASTTVAALAPIATHPVGDICPSSRTHASAGAAIETKMIKPNMVRGYRLGRTPVARRAASASRRTNMLMAAMSIQIHVSATSICGPRRPPNAATTIVTPGKSMNQPTKSHTKSSRTGCAPVRARQSRRLPSASLLPPSLTQSAPAHHRPPFAPMLQLRSHVRSRMSRGPVP